MAFVDGDFLEIEFTVWDTAENKIIATSDEKKAKDGGVFDEKNVYGPALIVLGSESVIKGLDRELRNMKEGETKKFTFKPQDAFGERREDLLHVVPIADFRKQDMEPYPGMKVNIDERVTAVVKSVNSGRVVLDANHPYAGKEVTYEVRLIRKLASDKDKVAALGRSYNLMPEVTASADKVDILFNDNVKKDADYFIEKASLVAAVFANLKNVKKIEVREQYTFQEEKEEKKEAAKPKKA